MKLVNKAGRSLGVPGVRASIVLGKGESADITDADLAAIKNNRTAKSWLDSGSLVVEGVTQITVTESTIADTQEFKPLESTEAPEPKDSEIKDDPVAEVVVNPQPSDTAIVKHVGRGRYNAFVNDEPLSDDPLDKAEAEKMAGEYNAVSS